VIAKIFVDINYKNRSWP